MNPVDRAVLERWWHECRHHGGGLPRGVEPVLERLVRRVGRGTLPEIGAVFVKVMSFPRPKDRVRYLVRALPARCEARMLERIRSLGIPAPRVLFWRTLRVLGLPRLSMLVTEALPAADEGPTLEEMAGMAARLAEAGVVHPDLNAGNFLRLRDGRVAVLDLQSGRSGRVRRRDRRRMAAKLLAESGTAATGLELVRAGLISAAELAAVRAVAERMRRRWLLGRIRRCLAESTEFTRRRRWNGVRHVRRAATTTPLRRIQGGRETLRWWIGDRAREVLFGDSPLLAGLFRKSWWLPGKSCVYISAHTEDASVPDRIPGLLEGFERYRDLKRAKALRPLRPLTIDGTAPTEGPGSPQSEA